MTMDKDRTEGSMKNIKGSIKEGVGKAVGDSLEDRWPAAAQAPALAKSSGVLMLKNGSRGSLLQEAWAIPCRFPQSLTLRKALEAMASLRSWRRSTGQRPTAGWSCPPEAAQARGWPAASRASWRRGTRSGGRKGVSPGAETTQARAGRWRAAH